MHNKYIITYECHDNAPRMWKVVQLIREIFWLLPVLSPLLPVVSHFSFVSTQISIKLFYLYQRLQCRDNYFFKIRNLFSFFICGCQHHERKTICLYVYTSDIRQIVGYRTPVFIQPFPWRHILSLEKAISLMGFNTVVSIHVNSDHVPSFSCLDIWTNRQATSDVYAITVTTSTYHSRYLQKTDIN
jgi:hypothetical protein